MSQARADRLRSEGRVHPVDVRAAWLIEGDHGAYVVVADRAGNFHCPCPASSECSHTIAARDELAQQAGAAT